MKKTRRFLNMSLFFAFFAACLIAGKGAPQTQYDYALTLGEETFDPTRQVIVMPTQWEFSSQFGNALRLVQFDGPIQEEWISELKDAGITPIQYIHPFTYITWALPSSLEKANTISNLRFAGDFLNGYKVLPKWRNLSDEQVKTKLMVYKGSSLDETIALIREAGAIRIDSNPLDNRFEIISCVISGSKFIELSKIQSVLTIQPAPTDGGLRSEMSSQVNAGNVNGSNQAFPGYRDWLDSIGLGGSDVIIAIVDGGSDQNHSDLSGQFVSCDGQSCGGNASSSHGTHTAGIVGGTGNSGTTDSGGFLRGMGVAPDVSLLEQVYSPTFQQPGGMTQLMYDSHANGAIASSNSWGPAGSPQGYDIDTLETDIGIRDADPETAGNQQFSYVLAFMNGSGGTSSQGSPDEAKNIFTIGSTKMRTSSGSQDLNINDISSNSAHGPALDGRTIPHMVAPGCLVDSTIPGSHGLMCGTSMACPQAAGAVALFAEQYKNAFEVEPSPALIKAAFTAGSLDLAGFDDADGNTLGHRFDSKQGWGRMDLPGVLYQPEGSVRYFDAPVVFEQTGDQWSTTVSPLDQSKPMKIMLVWTDAVGHGLGGSTPAWNNDLDLTVTTGVSTYRGNNFGSNGWSTTGGNADDRNNTEGVFFGPNAPSQATITITAANLNSDGIPNVGDEIDQDFSLVCYNCSVEPGFSMSVSPASQSVCAPETVSFDVEIGQIMGYDEEITLSVITGAGIDASFSDDVVTPPATVTMTVNVAGSVSSGTHNIEIEGTSDDGSSHTTVAGIDVSNSLPSQVVLMSPANNASDVTIAPTFDWNTTSNVTAYRLQLSTTMSPAGIIHDVSNISENSYQLPMTLSTNSDYYWRVNASNNCGDGAWSGWWTFMTTDAMTVLLVDDDNNDPNVLSYYTDSLANNGILYEVFDTNNSNNEPSANDLSGYPLVIWFTGVEWGGMAGPGSAGETALATYIDNGGHLFLSSQDYLYDMGLTSFGQNYLGISSANEDIDQTSVTGLNLFDAVGNVTLNYPFSNWSDAVSPSSEAVVVFEGNEGDTGLRLEQADGGSAIFLGFPYEALPVDAQDEVLTAILSTIVDDTEPCPADCNGDGGVNVTDLLTIISEWGNSTGCDINEDGIINITDLLAVISNWGECP